MGTVLFILAVFYIGYGTGSMRQDDDRFPVRGLMSMAVGGIATAVIFLSVQGAPLYYGAVFIPMFLIALFALVFVLGFGRFLGSVVPLVFSAGRPRLSAGVVTLIAPALLLLWMLHRMHAAVAAEDARKAALLAALQDGTYRAAFGTHRVTFPGAPAIEIWHECREGKRTCRTMFWHSPGFNQVDGSALRLTSISLADHQRVRDTTRTWCATRREYSDTVWCGRDDLTNVTLRLKEDIGFFASWIEFPAPRAGARVFCLENRSNPACRVYFEVAPGSKR